MTSEEAIAIVSSKRGETVATLKGCDRYAVNPYRAERMQILNREIQAIDLAIVALRREAAVGELVEAARSLLEKQQFFCKNAMYTDAMPGNEFYSDMFMEVIIATRKALSKFDGQREGGKDDSV